MINSVIRLLSVLGEKTQLTFMANHIRREVIFYMLCGSCGKQFLTSIINVRQAGEIYEVNSWIKKNFRSSFTVEELAEQKNMSVVPCSIRNSRALWAWDRFSVRNGCVLQKQEG